MNNELIIKTNTQKHKTFLQNGFYSHKSQTSPPHNHNYAEIHISTGGEVKFRIEKNIYSTNNGNLIIIPKGIFHSCINREENVLHTAFQIDCNVNEFSSYSISDDTVSDFLKEIKICKDTGNYTKVSSYIALFLSHLTPHENITVQPISDYSFLIHDFFAVRYNENLHLSDLASVLHLSQRQTERLIIKHTGNNFKENLIKTRINMAKQLLNTTNMTLGEIAVCVGYNSYAGFWKAFQKYNS